MMLPSRLGCPLSLKTPNMGNTGLLALMATVAVLVACSQAAAPPDGIPAPDATAAAALQGLMPDDGSFYMAYRGVETMEEAIIRSDVIARASYLSKRTYVKQVSSPGDSSPQWFPVLEFRFRVHEYLKGSGPNEIGGLVYVEWGTRTETEAQTVASQMASAHDSRWGSREAIVFLQTVYPARGGQIDLRGDSDQHWVGPLLVGSMPYGLQEGYTVASIYRKAWLPEAAPSGGSRQVTVEKLFLLDVPSGDATIARAGGGSTSTAPTISLSAMKSRIATLEAEASVGGTAECRKCVLTAYSFLRSVAYEN